MKRYQISTAVVVGIAVLITEPRLGQAPSAQANYNCIAFYYQLVKT